MSKDTSYPVSDDNSEMVPSNHPSLREYRAKQLVQAVNGFMSGIDAYLRNECAQLQTKTDLGYGDLDALEKRLEIERERRYAVFCDQLRKESSIAPRIVAKEVFGQGHGGYTRSAYLAFSDILQLRALRSAVVDAGVRMAALEFPRLLARYANEYNARNPTAPVHTALRKGQTYEAHFNNPELTYGVLPVLDGEIIYKSPVSLNGVNPTYFRKLGVALAQKIDVLVKNDTARENERLMVIKAKARKAVAGSRTTTAVLQIAPKELEELLESSAHDEE